MGRNATPSPPLDYYPEKKKIVLCFSLLRSPISTKYCWLPSWKCDFVCTTNTQLQMVSTLDATCAMCIISRGFHHMIEKCMDAIKCLATTCYLSWGRYLRANEFQNFGSTLCTLKDFRVHRDRIIRMFTFICIYIRVCVCVCFFLCLISFLVVNIYQCCSLNICIPWNTAQSRLETVAIVWADKGCVSMCKGVRVRVCVCLTLIFGFLSRLFAI